MKLLETPAALKIAVSGHRRLDNLEALQKSIQDTAARIETAFPNQNYQVLSCLAEGADRLLTEALLTALKAALTLVLPLPEAEYLKDFQQPQSIDDYYRLRGLAREVVYSGNGVSRPLAYQAANRYLVDACDLLLAIWDGKQARGPGGTGDAMELARQASKPVLWIHHGGEPDSGTLIIERLNFPG